MDITGGYQRGGGKGKMREKVQGIRSINDRYKIDGEAKNSMGNGEAKELICMNHGYELKWGNVGGRDSAGWKGTKGREKKGLL